jgi:hypothetical protein
MTSTTHLRDDQLVDAVDGRHDAGIAAHLAECATCDARVRELRSMLQTVATDDVPEPSPLFWEHFPARVSRAIDAAPEPRGWGISPRWWWGSGAVVATIVILLMLPLLPMSRETGTLAPAPQVSETTPATAIVTANPESFEALENLEDLEDNEAWAMVRAVAEATDYDDVREIGLTPRPGSLERAAIEMTSDERAELARLIELELKRTGASTP